MISSFASAGVQPGQNEFDARDLFLRVFIDRHPATVIGDLEGSVRMQRHVDSLAVAGDGFVDTIVDHLVGQVIRPGRIGVHARTAPDRIKAAEYLDVSGIVVSVHWITRGRPPPASIAHNNARILEEIEAGPQFPRDN